MVTRAMLGRTLCARPAAARRGEAGFTLVELLVMMTILVLIASLVGPRVIGYIGSSKAKAARIEIESLTAALQLYRIDNSRYPTSAQGLRALVERPAVASGWNGPYLAKRDVPRDPWGNEFVYRSPGQRGDFDIISLGADNQVGGTGENADITNSQ
ncbi:MAG: type II secretion system major pseudopilin GspG [Hyphomicrobiaceae bacterium]|nr:type II secretion system major pseudopilin GspG [Hyphomicrobiaceae bacterium]